MKVKLVNETFKQFISTWDKKFFFAVGGYGSGKSYHVGLKIIIKCLQEKRKVLVVREVYATLKDSCYSLLIEILEELEIEEYYIATTSPLRIKFINGSEIMFRGCDKPEKLKSLNGVSICWLEEPTEIKYAAFKELLGRLRMSNISLHFLMSLNPVSKSSWVYKHFIDRKKIDEIELYNKKVIIDDDTFFHHSTVDDNKFVSKDYVEQLDELSTYDVDLHRIARLGHFGELGEKVFNNVIKMSKIEIESKINSIYRSDNIERYGMDFGFVTSYNAIVKCNVDHKNKILYISYEYYKKGMTDDQTANEIQHLKNVRIIAESAEPKAIKYYNQQGFNFRAVKKGKVIDGIKKLKRFKQIIISEECPNCYREFKELAYKKNKNDDIIEDEYNLDCHSVDSVRYSLDDYEVSDLKGNSLRAI